MDKIIFKILINELEIKNKLIINKLNKIIKNKFIMNSDVYKNCKKLLAFISKFL